MPWLTLHDGLLEILKNDREREQKKNALALMGSPTASRSVELGQLNVKAAVGAVGQPKPSPKPDRDQLPPHGAIIGILGAVCLNTPARCEARPVSLSPAPPQHPNTATMKYR